MSVSYSFGIKSLQRLCECDPKLQLICHELIKELDVSILCGHRDKAEQDKAFMTGKSKLKWPDSKHNSTPSRAVDLAPWDDKIKGINWTNTLAFQDMCQRIERIAGELGIKIRLGRDFSFQDIDHLELA
jgi:peptidoglycan L-alanyl-D-glutamate endopeptidase CwlK